MTMRTGTGIRVWSGRCLAVQALPALKQPANYPRLVPKFSSFLVQIFFPYAANWCKTRNCIKRSNPALHFKTTFGYLKKLPVDALGLVLVDSLCFILVDVLCAVLVDALCVVFVIFFKLVLSLWAVTSLWHQIFFSCEMEFLLI